MFPFIFGGEPPKTPLIDYVTEIKIEEKIEPEVTLEDKIRLDINDCEPSHWISAEDASCITKLSREKPVQTIKNTSNVVRAGSASSGWYSPTQCTGYVASRRAVGQWNNASDWLWQAKRDGWATGSTPQAGAIAWRSGHVAFIESVSGSSMVISERNYDLKGSFRTITVPATSYTAFIY